MMKIRRNLLMLAFLGTAGTMQAQQFVLFKSDGTKVKLNVAEIDSIAFHNDEWKDPDGTPNRVKMSFTATIGSNETNAKGIHKVAFGGSGETKAMYWATEDPISIYTSSSNDCFKLSSGAGTSEGKFSGTTYASGSVTAVYPYQSHTAMSSSQVNDVILPVVQTATEGSFSSRAGLMIGECNDVSVIGSNPIAFKNICSYIAVTPTFDCTQIIVSTRNPNEYLAGSIHVNYNNGDPTWSIINGSNKVTLKGTITRGKTYYIAVLPGTLSSGIRIACFSGGNYTAKKTSQTVTLQRSQYTDFSNFLATPASSSYVDLGLSVKWATMNIGATAPYEFGDYFSWGETTPMNAYYYDDDLQDQYKYIATNDNYYYGSTDEYKENKISTVITEDDAATEYLGSNWRMPTQAEFNELISDCIWTYTDNYNNSGIKGYIVYKKSTETDHTYSLDYDNHIFLPYTGRYEGASRTALNNTTGYYWSSTVNTSGYTTAYNLKISTNTSAVPQENSYGISTDSRPYCCTIRPVYVGTVQ